MWKVRDLLRDIRDELRESNRLSIESNRLAKLTIELAAETDNDLRQIIAAKREEE